MSGVVYGALWVFFKVIGRLCFRLHTVGGDSIPRNGGLVIAANHASYLDIPLLGSGLPRRVAFLGRQDLFPIPGLRPILRRLGWIPIRLGRIDRAGFGRAIDLIKSGRAVVIFPEGSRSRDGQLGPGKPGIGVLVAETGCPVVPVYLEGTHKVLPVGARWPRFHRVRVMIGKPIDFTQASNQRSGKELYQYVSRTVMARIAELRQAAQPTNPSDGSPWAKGPRHHPATGPFSAE